MNASHTLTDRAALTRNRSRATDDALFLHRAALEEVDDRLSLVNRTFTSAAIVTGFPQVWGALHPNATLVEDTDTLALTQGAHDLVVHAMGMHWANDPVGQIIQSRRALQPDGLFLSVGFGGQTLHELRACLGQAEASITGGLSPRIAPMAELRDIGGLLQRAGLALPVADSVTLTTEYSDICSFTATTTPRQRGASKQALSWSFWRAGHRRTASPNPCDPALRSNAWPMRWPRQKRRCAIDARP